MARRRRSSTFGAQDLPAIVRLWILRLLVPMGGHKQFIMSHGFGDDTLAEVLGLGEWIDVELEDRFDSKAARVALLRLHRAAERNSGMTAATPERLVCNIARLSELVGLTDADARILEFAALIKLERLLEVAADYVGEFSTEQAVRALSAVLGTAEPEVRRSLGTQGALVRSGLLSPRRHSTCGLSAKLKLPSDEFADTLAFDADPVALLRGIVIPGEPAHLALDDFGHVTRPLAILRPYLKSAVGEARKGVNVLIHGAPGTGKSQLSKVLAGDIGCELLEMSCSDVDGDPIDGESRLRFYRTAQGFFARRRALIVFDEAEDVFRDWDGPNARSSAAQTHKGWMNRMLEENPLPTLWLSNCAEDLDPAFIRRFDMVIELPVPPKRQRERILQQACSDLIDARSLRRMAEHESLAPAIVSRAASVVRAIHSELDEVAVAPAVEALINGTLVAQGHQSIPRHEEGRLPEVYDPAFIHADADLARVAAGLVDARSGRLCLYGPPGTGKTAYGRWLAEQLGVPLLVRRASDLLSKWVGEAEKNVARAFREAEQEGALLLIDEVDSFLQDRRGARRSWEISLVNEVLTQMESYPGVFIASTNLMEGLDQAALRRFDLKVRFDFLRPEQAVGLLRRHCEALALPAPAPQHEIRLMRLDRLTPGDFAAALRQHRFRAIESPGDLVAALEAECELKEGAKAAIGFLH